jgi:hypothetical protein
LVSHLDYVHSAAFNIGHGLLAIVIDFFFWAGGL